jgi:mannose-6-phosphate isomerase-like protein (cupin superfamily)
MIRTAKAMETEVRHAMRGGTGSVTLQHFFKSDEITAKSRLCARLTLPPGASIGTHQHTGEDEVYIITRGSGLLDDGTAKTQVNVGDAILTGKGESHAITNTGPTELEIIAVIMCYA